MMEDEKMVSLKETKAEAKEKYGMSVSARGGNNPSYSYGTCLHFDSKRIIKELGLNDLKAGDEVKLVAKAKVTSVSTTAKEGDEDYMSMSIQLTDLKVEDVNGYEEGFGEED